MIMTKEEFVKEMLKHEVVKKSYKIEKVVQNSEVYHLMEINRYREKRALHNPNRTRKSI